ncbi:MAG: hypothetical protein R6V83_00605 [Candidatus Thorarchaeota archaeon]
MKTKLIHLSYLPIPEMVLKGTELRSSLSFLSKRETVWESFVQSVREEPELENAFVDGYSKLRWRNDGPRLRESLARIDKAHDKGIRTRVNMPLRTLRLREIESSGEKLQATEIVNIYPSLFAEYRLKIAPVDSDKVPASWLDNCSSFIHDSHRHLRPALSRTLFGKRDAIAARFSNFFTLRIEYRKGEPRGTKVAYDTYTSALTSEGPLIILRTATQASGLFQRRMMKAVSLALSQRIMIPALWNDFVTVGESQQNEKRELIEALMVNNNPAHYLHSEKLTPQILCYSYQRRAYEFVAGLHDIKIMSEDVKNKFGGWLQAAAVHEALPLLECTSPLREKLKKGIDRIAGRRETVDLNPPHSTVFDYLVFAYLLDEYRHRNKATYSDLIPDRFGIRTRNQIWNGSKRIESHLDIETKLEKSQIYADKHDILQGLANLNLAEKVSITRTSADWGIRVVEDSPHVTRALAAKKAEFGPEEVSMLGK